MNTILFLLFELIILHKNSTKISYYFNIIYIKLRKTIIKFETILWYIKYLYYNIYIILNVKEKKNVSKTYLIMRYKFEGNKISKTIFSFKCRVLIFTM